MKKDIAALRLIATQDRNRHNSPPYAYGVIFVLCGLIGGEFQENLKTTGCAYFGRNELQFSTKRFLNHTIARTILICKFQICKRPMSPMERGISRRALEKN